MGFALCVFVAPLGILVSIKQANPRFNLIDFHSKLTKIYWLFAEKSDQNQERGVYAIYFISFPHLRSSDVVLLRPFVEGYKHCCMLQSLFHVFEFLLTLETIS